MITIIYILAVMLSYGNIFFISTVTVSIKTTAITNLNLMTIRSFNNAMLLN